MQGGVSGLTDYLVGVFGFLSLQLAPVSLCRLHIISRKEL